MNDGWTCPVCRRGVAPSEKTCDHGGAAAVDPYWKNWQPIYPDPWEPGQWKPGDPFIVYATVPDTDTLSVGTLGITPEYLRGH